jgi:uncharacterized protein YjbJ (UPF0337 family)
MAPSTLELYEALASAPDDKTRAKLIAEAFERLEERYPHLPNLVTQGHLNETELRLRREIEQLRGELKTDIEQLRGEIKTEIEQLRGELKTDMEQLRGAVKTEIEQLRGKLETDIERMKNDLLKWLIPLMFAQVAAIAALVKML